MPDLASRLKDTKPKMTVDEGVYVYKRTGTNYIWRMWKPLFNVRGWAPKYYYDSAGSARSASHKRAFYYSRIKNIVRKKHDGLIVQTYLSKPKVMAYKPEGKE